MSNIKKSESFDVLIWNSTPENLTEFDDPCGMVNVTEEHINLSEKEAYKIYNGSEFYHKQLIKYKSSDEDSDGDVIEEESNDLIFIDEKFKISSDKFDELVESKVEDFINNWSIDEDDYENLIDEISEPIQIGNLSYSAGETLRAVDPIAFRCGCAEEECPDHEIDEKRDEIIEELEKVYEVVEELFLHTEECTRVNDLSFNEVCSCQGSKN